MPDPIDLGPPAGPKTWEEMFGSDPKAVAGKPPASISGKTIWDGKQFWVVQPKMTAQATPFNTKFVPAGTLIAVSQDGSQTVDLPAGEYVTGDGDMVVIAANGTISSSYSLTSTERKALGLTPGGGSSGGGGNAGGGGGSTGGGGGGGGGGSTGGGSGGGVAGSAAMLNAEANMLSSEASMKNAGSNKIQALANAIETWMKVTNAPADEAWKRFNAELTKLQLTQDQEKTSGNFALETSGQNLQRANMMNADARERELAEAGRKTDLQQTATQRAQSAARDILPYAVPGATSMTLPLLGEMPLAQVNLDQFYSQGLPPLLDQWNQPIAAGAPNPWPEATPLPSLTPLAMPQMPAAQPAPDIDALLAKILGYA